MADDLLENELPNDPHAHAGHRQRVREKVFQGGMASMPDHELIEFLLFYAIPKRDVNPLAHALMNEYGSLDRLFAADEEELRQFPGVGPGVARLIASYGTAVRQYLESQASPGGVVTPASAIETARAHFVHPTRQEMAVICMDGGGALLNCAVRDWDIIQDAEGARWLVEQAFNSGAHQLTLVWRRYAQKRGLTAAELESLGGLVTMLGSIEIRLVDFILLHRDGQISLRENGQLVDQSDSLSLALAGDVSGDFIAEGLVDEDISRHENA